MDSVYGAFLLIILAGLLQGSFVVPMKATKQWEWENNWLGFTFLGLVVLPALVAVLTVPQAMLVLSSSPARSIWLAALLGLGWGCGSACFGLGVREVGMGLAFSIVAGLSGAFGSLIPWFSSPVKTYDYSVLLWSGVFIMLIGVGICAVAGRERERALGAQDREKRGQKQFSVGLTICIIGGILSCFMNLGFVYGAEVARQAQALGASAENAPNVLWMVIMTGGFVANALYCGRILLTRGTLEKYRAPGSLRNWGWIVLMALIWEGNLLAYAAGANRIGNLGPSVGWPAVLSMTLITSNVWGVLTGEWRGAGRKAGMLMVAGIGTLVVAVAVLGWASSKV
jgi:L-rhamnose-H+ transport protein